MKLLMLYGVNCTKEIWDILTPYLAEHEVDYVEYPHEVTEKAKEVEDITKWVYATYHNQSYDAVIGHSLGGIIALQLASEYKMNFNKIIYLDTNLKPANEFYRNLMTPEHLEQYGNEILPMFQEERKHYTPELFKQLQSEFDYTYYLNNIKEPIYAIYGDRNMPEYPNKIQDLNLPAEILKKLNLTYIPNACHMIMIENPYDLYLTLKSILEKSNSNRF